MAKLRFSARADADDGGGRPSSLRAHLVAASGELVGTILFLYFAFAGHLMVLEQRSACDTADNGRLSGLAIVHISLIYGFSLLVTAWSFYRISGGLFNPAVTLGMSLSGALPWTRAAVLFPAQIVGGIVAAALVSCMFPGDIAVVNTALSPDTSVAQGLFIEMFLTSQLLFTVLMLAAEKSKDTFIAPVGIGLSLFVAELAGVYYTGGSLNPARSFGPSVASAHFPAYHWIYWLGPFLGAVLTSGYYRFVKAMHYEDSNPGQDAAGQDRDEV